MVTVPEANSWVHIHTSDAEHSLATVESKELSSAVSTPRGAGAAGAGSKAGSKATSPSSSMIAEVFAVDSEEKRAEHFQKLQEIIVSLSELNKNFLDRDEPMQQEGASGSSPSGPGQNDQEETPDYDPDDELAPLVEAEGQLEQFSKQSSAAEMARLVELLSDQRAFLEKMQRESEAREAAEVDMKLLEDIHQGRTDMAIVKIENMLPEQLLSLGDVAGMSALHHAVRASNLRVVWALLERAPALAKSVTNLNRTPPGWSALMILRGESQQFLKAIPSIAEEHGFRQKMTKTSQRFASESVKLSQQAQELRRVCAILKPKPSEADKGLIPQWEEKAQLAEGVSQVCTSLVTLFAGVTLLRSPMAGTKADEGKKTCKSIDGLLKRALQEDLPKTPVTIILPDDATKQLVVDMAAAVSWRHLTPSGSHCFLCFERAGFCFQRARLESKVTLSLGKCCLDVEKQWSIVQEKRPSSLVEKDSSGPHEPEEVTTDKGGTSNQADDKDKEMLFGHDARQEGLKTKPCQENAVAKVEPALSDPVVSKPGTLGSEHPKLDSKAETEPSGESNPPVTSAGASHGDKKKEKKEKKDKKKEDQMSKEKRKHLFEKLQRMLGKVTKKKGEKEKRKTAKEKKERKSDKKAKKEKDKKDKEKKEKKDDKKTEAQKEKKRKDMEKTEKPKKQSRKEEDQAEPGGERKASGKRPRGRSPQET